MLFKKTLALSTQDRLELTKTRKNVLENFPDYHPHTFSRLIKYLNALPSNEHRKLFSDEQSFHKFLTFLHWNMKKTHQQPFVNMGFLEHLNSTLVLDYEYDHQHLRRIKNLGREDYPFEAEYSGFSIWIERHQDTIVLGCHPGWSEGYIIDSNIRAKLEEILSLLFGPIVDEIRIGSPSPRY